MSATIVSYQSVEKDPAVQKELREIFFESSTKKEFKDEAEKEAFFYKYLGFYLEHYPKLAWVALTDKVLGYVVVSPQSKSEELIKLQPHLKVFDPECEKFPAHLHINCHSDSRGLGVGSRLINEAVEALKNSNIRGLHIMTGLASQNRSFYRKLGFSFEVERNFHGSSILFMGKSLSEDSL